MTGEHPRYDQGESQSLPEHSFESGFHGDTTENGQLHVGRRTESIRQDDAVAVAREALNRLHASAVPVGEYSPHASLERDDRPEAVRDKVYGRDIVDALDEYGEAIARAEAVGNAQAVAREADGRSRILSEAFFDIQQRLAESPMARYTMQTDIKAVTGQGVDPVAYLEALSAEGFEDLVRYHVERTERRIVEARTQLPELKAAFSNNVTVLAAHQEWPITADDLERRIERVQVSFTDGLESERNLENHGYYRPMTNELMINVSSADMVDLHHVYNHEMLHAISGRDTSILPQGDETPTLDLERFGYAVPARDGDRDNGTGSPAARTGRYTWLNEAVTESAANQLEGSDAYLEAAGQRQLYLAEQQLLQRIEQRVPRQAIMAAYFESRNPDGAPPREMARLQGLITASFEPDLLLKLDRIVGPDSRSGLSAAISYMETNYPPEDPEPRGRIQRRLKQVGSKLRPSR